MVWRPGLVSAARTLLVIVSSVSWIICILLKVSSGLSQEVILPILKQDTWLYVNSHCSALSSRSPPHQESTACVVCGSSALQYLHIYSRLYLRPEARRRDSGKETHRRRETDLTRRWHKPEEATAPLANSVAAPSTKSPLGLVSPCKHGIIRDKSQLASVAAHQTSTVLFLYRPVFEPSYNRKWVSWS